MINTIIFESETFQLSGKMIVHGKGNSEDVESVGGNMFIQRILLLLDRFLEGADRLGVGDLHWEDTTGVIPENQAIEFHDTHKVRTPR
jgi:hypothetical protein